MTTAQMKYFIETASSLSFTEAADRLYISQSSLSRHISSIEAELNVQLFIRSKNRVYLTPAGNMLLEGLKKIYSEYNSLTDRVSKINANAKGGLNLGLLEEELLPEAIKKVLTLLAINNPKTEINLTSHSFKPLIDGLFDGRLDLIVTFSFELKNMKGLEFRVLETLPLCLMVQAGHPVAARAAIDLMEFGTLLKDDCFILMSPKDTRASADTIANDFRRAGFIPKYKYAPTPALYSLWVAAGQGLAVVSSRHANSNNPDVRLIPIVGMKPLEVVLAWVKPITNPSVPLFIERINEVI